MQESEGSLLPLLMEHEEEVGRLYEAFASGLPEHEALWRKLAGDERRHATALGHLRADPGIEVSWQVEAGIRPAAVRSSIEYVRSQRQKAQTGGLDSLRALAVAADLENALIERQFSRVTVSASGEVRRVLEMLAAETMEHRDELEHALAAERAMRRPG